MKTEILILIGFLSGFFVGLIFPEIVRKAIKYFTPQTLSIEGEYVKSWKEPIPVLMDSTNNYVFDLGNSMQWPIVFNVDQNYLLIKDDHNNEIIVKISLSFLNKIKSQPRNDKRIIVVCKQFLGEEEPEVVNVI